MLKNMNLIVLFIFNVLIITDKNLRLNEIEKFTYFKYICVYIINYLLSELIVLHFF